MPAYSSANSIRRLNKRNYAWLAHGDAFFLVKQEKLVGGSNVFFLVMGGFPEQNGESQFCRSTKRYRFGMLPMKISSWCG